MTDPVIELVDLSMPWEGLDPFLFTVHHVDAYPAGNEALGPVASLAGRMLGSDFSYRDGWSMYHGSVVPGFPQHPHRGFETVTVVRRGFVDHSDSLGATARYGEGDVQWLTTGSGIMHAEMFPLLDADGPNPLELFQIWLNLPPETKMVPPHFGMLWSEEIPTLEFDDSRVNVDVIAGTLGENHAPAPPPDSWAARADSAMAIWLVRLAPGARWILPSAPSGVNRMLYCFEGTDVLVGSSPVTSSVGVRLRPEVPTPLENHGQPAEFLLLQGRPIGAPIVQVGPFVMNTPEEIGEAIDDYRRTGFGGWPWANASPVHPRTDGRFALHADGRLEHRDMPAGV